MMLEYKSISWWYWLVSAVLLFLWLFGWTEGFPLVLSLTLIQTFHFLIEEKKLTAFPIQIRIAYLIILLAGWMESLRFLHWIQAIGTSVIVVTGYCFLARALALMPWNRKQPLSLDLIRNTIFSPPVRGNIMQGLPKTRTTPKK